MLTPIVRVLVHYIFLYLNPPIYIRERLPSPPHRHHPTAQQAKSEVLDNIGFLYTSEAQASVPHSQHVVDAPKHYCTRDSKDSPVLLGHVMSNKTYDRWVDNFICTAYEIWCESNFVGSAQRAYEFAIMNKYAFFPNISRAMKKRIHTSYSI